jgi:hypothetical protein
MYVTGTGSRTYTNTNGRDYISGYIGGVTAGGETLEYPVKETGIKVGDVVRIGFEGNDMTVAKLSGGSVSGTVDAELLTVGNLNLSDGVRILDTYEGAYVPVSVQRLDGVKLAAEEVLFREASNGRITALILKDATGDCGTYGVITSARKTGSDMNVSGEYSYLTGGAAYSLSTQGSAFGAAAGPAKFVFSGEKLVSMRNLKGISGKVKSFDGAELTAQGAAGYWKISDNVEIYTKSQNSTNYAHATLDDATEAFASGQTLDFYYDDTPEGGGLIRVIIIRE